MAVPVEALDVEAQALEADLAAADDPDQLRAEIADRLNRVRSPHRSAEFFEIEQIIDPRDTRPLLVDWARRAHELTGLSGELGPRARGLRP